MRIQLIFDGGNGASLDKEAYGSYSITSGGITKLERVTFGTGYTNNEAEYMTLIAALERILAALESKNIAPFDVDLLIQGDSMLVKEQIGTHTFYHDTLIYNWTGWKVNVAHLLPLRNKARRLLEQFYRFDYQHIPRKEVVKVLGH